MKRRNFMQGAALATFTMTPIAALLSACGRESGLPEGMVAINWDRDVCTRCGMGISDRRFAVEALGGGKREPLKFDDIGCAMVWLKQQSWGNDAATRIWVADVGGVKGDRWLDARKAQYVGGRASPMGYNFGAVEHPEAGSLAFDAMRQHVLAREGAA